MPYSALYRKHSPPVVFRPQERNGQVPGYSRISCPPVRLVAADDTASRAEGGRRGVADVERRGDCSAVRQTVSCVRRDLSPRPVAWDLDAHIQSLAGPDVQLPFPAHLTCPGDLSSELSTCHSVSFQSPRRAERAVPRLRRLLLASGRVGVGSGQQDIALALREPRRLRSSPAAKPLFMRLSSIDILAT